MKRINSQRIASIGILSALSLVFLFAVKPIPIFAAVPFLELDFADIPIFIATFMYGPWIGLAITLVVCLTQGIIISSIAGIMGILMHFFATGSFVIVAGLIYKKFHTLKGAIVAEIFGIITWILVMIPFNLLITPLFMKCPISAVIDILPFIIAFNAIKSSVNALATLIIYKHTHKLFNKMLPQHNNALTSKPIEADITSDSTEVTPTSTSTQDLSNNDAK